MGLDADNRDAPTTPRDGVDDAQAAARRASGADAAQAADHETSGAASRSKVVVLAGGTGGAKLARGMLDVVGADELVVIANTGDDIDIYGARVSPDPDLVSFWLADLIDERGWGLRGDTFNVMQALRELDVDVWFELGDRDLAWCLERRRMLDEEMTPSEALRVLNERIDVRAAVLPVSDEPLRTWVYVAEREWRPFQEFMIRDRCHGTIEAVSFSAGDLADLHPAEFVVAPRIARPGDLEYEPPRAAPSPDALAALRDARAVIVGPSNPIISIWPILWTLEDALRDVQTPVVCVSPIVAGEIVKGPTAAFLSAYGQPLSASGVSAFYESVHSGLLHGIVADEPLARSQALPSLRIDTAMRDPSSRARVAEQTLSFALSLAS